MPELIKDKQTGYLVNSVEEAVNAVDDINSINRKYCNEWALSNFSLEKMVDSYYNVYKQVLEV